MGLATLLLLGCIVDSLLNSKTTVTASATHFVFNREPHSITLPTALISNPYTVMTNLGAHSVDRSKQVFLYSYYGIGKFDDVDVAKTTCKGGHSILHSHRHQPYQKTDRVIVCHTMPTCSKRLWLSSKSPPFITRSLDRSQASAQLLSISLVGELFRALNWHARKKYLHALFSVAGMCVSLHL